MDAIQTLLQAKAIALKAMEGTATPEEKKTLRLFVDTFPDKDQLITILFPASDWRQVEDQILPAGLEERILTPILKRSSRAPSAWWLAAAVLLGACLVTGIWIYSRRLSSHGQELTFTTIHTRNGQEKLLTLADGTHILLNGGTSIRYAQNFGSASRDVYLDGEAFFDVAKGSSHPFIVHSKWVITTVLGTTFSMRTSDQDQGGTTVEVASGKVRMALNPYQTGLAPTAILASAQKGRYRQGDSSAIQTTEVPLSEVGAWKDHNFFYDQTPLRDILKDLERTYDLHFSIQDQAILGCTYSATFRNLNPSSILQTLSLMGH